MFRIKRILCATNAETRFSFSSSLNSYPFFFIKFYLGSGREIKTFKSNHSYFIFPVGTFSAGGNAETKGSSIKSHTKTKCAEATTTEKGFL